MPSGSSTSSGALVTAVVLILAALACLDSRAEAIRCYDCNSFYDPRCGDPFDPYTLGIIDCNDRPALDHLSGQNATLCRKLVQKISGKDRVVRGCGYIEDSRDGECVQRSGTHDISVHYCSCKGDICNGGTRPGVSATLAAALVIPVLEVAWRLS